MGLFENLFGGSGEKSALTPGQSKVLNKLTDLTYRDLDEGIDLYGGKLLSDITPNMNLALSGYADAAKPNPYVGSAIASALSGAGDYDAVKRTFESQLDPARREFGRALEQVTSDYGDTWGRSGALPEMVGRTTADYGGQLNALLGDMVLQDRTNALNRQMNAIPLANANRQSDLGALDVLYGAGQRERGFEQERLNTDYNQWMAQQWYNTPSLNLLGPILGTQAKIQTQKPGILNSVANTVGNLSNMASGFFG